MHKLCSDEQAPFSLTLLVIELEPIHRKKQLEQTKLFCLTLIESKNTEMK